VLAEMGRLGDALKEYERTIEDFSGEPVAVCGRAGVLKEMGSLDRSLDAYTHAITAFPANPIPRCGQAEVLKDMGRLAVALEAYTQTVLEFPWVSVPYSGRAETLKTMGRFKQALAIYEEAMQKFPGDTRLRDGHADVLKRMGRLTESLRAYDENVKRFPYDIVAWTGRAELLKELGRFEEAIAAYDVLIALSSGKQRVRNGKAAVLVILRRYEDALKLLSEGDPRTRDEWISEHIRGMILLKRGKLDFAAKLFETSLTRIPFANERGYFESALAVTRIRMNKFTQAIESLGARQEPLTDVLRLHAFGGLQQLGEAREVLKRLEPVCPANLIPLKNELLARYKLSSKAPRHHPQWVFDEECRSILLEAA
jgi:tetratricopeptide (TPR) repeat protein